jgi:hypothetical protein
VRARAARAAALGVEPLPLAYESKSDMSALCENLNHRHLMAQLAGRASVSLHTNIFFKVRRRGGRGLARRRARVRTPLRARRTR